MEDTEKKILQAAREEFINTGLKGARMQEIADRAGVNKALLHYYFRTKEKLYVAALQDIIEILWGKIESDLGKFSSEPDLRTQIRLIVISYNQTMRENPIFIRFVMREMADGGDIIPKLATRIMGRYGNIPMGIMASIEDGIKKGIIRNDIRPFDAFFNIMGMCMISFIIQPVAEKISGPLGMTFSFDDKFYERRIESIINVACDGLFVKDACK